MYPTSGNSDLEEMLTADERTIVFVPNDPAHPSGISCNPVNSRASCKYYVSVEGIDDIYNEATFQITAIRPGNLAVIPCGSSPAPDGITTWGIDRVHQEMQGYELCGTDLVAPHGFLDVTLEICSGNLELRICDGDNSCNGVVPSHNDYSVYSTPETTCTFKPKVEVTPTCQMNAEGTPVSVQVSYASVDTYFMSVTGSGTYNMVLGSFKSDDFNPHIKSSGSVTTSNGGSVTLNWNPGRVVLSGIPNGVEPPLMDYEVYYVKNSLLLESVAKFDGTEHEINLLSRCGLVHMIDIVQPDVNIDVNSPDYGMVYVENHDENPNSYTFSGLTEDEDFVFYVVGKCDSKCMTQIVATNSETNVQCSVFSPCSTVYGLFPAVKAKTAGGGMFGRSTTTAVAGAIGGLVGIGALVGLILLCKKRRTVEGGGVIPGRSRFGSGFNWGRRSETTNGRAQPDLSALNLDTFSPFRVEETVDYRGEGAIELGDLSGVRVGGARAGEGGAQHVIGDDDDDGESDTKETGKLREAAGDVRDVGYQPPVNPFANNQLVEKEPEEFHI
mmetsp:Transcript_25888/g.48782  ORF Transcript_25888/g.48782 Transcript_25888/m.48782 type:complete len:555 (+) Transcript_25888:307-1971(+)